MDSTPGFEFILDLFRLLANHCPFIIHKTCYAIFLDFYSYMMKALQGEIWLNLILSTIKKKKKKLMLVLPIYTKVYFKNKKMFI